MGLICELKFFNRDSYPETIDCIYKIFLMNIWFFLKKIKLNEKKYKLD